MKLRSIVKDSGTGVQGHTRTPGENARAMLHSRLRRKSPQTGVQRCVAELSPFLQWSQAHAS